MASRRPGSTVRFYVIFLGRVRELKIGPRRRLYPLVAI